MTAVVAAAAAAESKTLATQIKDLVDGKSCGSSNTSLKREFDAVVEFLWMYFSPQAGFVRPLITLIAEYALVCCFARVGVPSDVGGWRSGSYELMRVVVQYDDTFTTPLDIVAGHTAPPGAVTVIGQGRFALLGKKKSGGSSVTDYTLFDSQDSASPHPLNAHVTERGSSDSHDSGSSDSHDRKYGDRLYIIGTLPNQLIIADDLSAKRKNPTGSAYGYVIDSSGDHVHVRPIRWDYKSVIVDRARYEHIEHIVVAPWTPLDADEYVLPRGETAEPVWIRAIYNVQGALVSIEAASFERYDTYYETTRFIIDEKGVPRSLLIYSAALESRASFNSRNWENSYHPGQMYSVRWAQPRAERPDGEAPPKRHKVAALTTAF